MSRRRTRTIPACWCCRASPVRPRSCTGALIVNPYDVYGVAAAIDQALTMKPAERQERHGQLLEAVRANDIQAWRKRCVAALEGTPVVVA